ncbi:MAG: cupin domain-containing protein [Patescibacteria group bacterium]|nr:cupin domain-containing protein [Patescibacteria group bacterium]
MDTSKLKNGKYFYGQYANFSQTRGWFVGSFFEEKHPCKTDVVEACYHEHKKGDVVEPHYHKLKVELFIILEGKAIYTVNDKEVMLNKGDFIFVGVNNVVSIKFLEITKVFAIHSPSIPGDKVVV